MPLPMIHFQVAVHFFRNEDIPDSFILGSIAPDAIHMRKNASREDKKRTHFDAESDTSKRELVQREYSHYISMNADEEWKWFVRGYFAHVLTDYFWVQQVYSSFKEKALADGLEPESMRRAYYRDTDQIDFNYYRNKPWTGEVWSQLIQSKAFALEPYVTFDEVNYWRYRTVHWFDLLAKEPGETPRYITEPMTEEFSQAVAERVKQVLTDWDPTL
ncbi:hypothetical protein [Paenibacillus sp. 32352]|uniref:hypothetical protein n=1 Tax=Paenibacillus sp. 32352 TaxID=1969111 RepID=UPI0009AD0F24|nr:hypothetical protein [Paenibacillus sp. 32352]